MDNNKQTKPMTATIENNELVIRITISKQPSKSGKTILVASTHGGEPTAAVVDGKPVTVSLNAWIAK